MPKNIQHILYMVARDFVQLSFHEQKQIGMKLGLVHVSIIMNTDVESVTQTIFAKAYQNKKIPELVKEMRQYLYE